MKIILWFLYALNFCFQRRVAGKANDVMGSLDVTHLVRYKLSLSTTNSNNHSDVNYPIYFCNRKLAKLSDPCLCYVDVNNQTIDNKSIHCAMTFRSYGRLGNVIGQYATLLVLARLNRRPSFMTPQMADVLKRYFKVTIPQLTSNWSTIIPWNWYRIHDWMEPWLKSLSGVFVQLYGFPSSFSFFQGFVEELKREFRVQDVIRERAQKVLRSISYGRKSTTFIGVHVRRGDYIYFIDKVYHGVLADRNFFIKATNYFRLKYHDAVFVVVSNGMLWCKENIDNNKKDVFYVGNNNETAPITDFAILMSCNHSIITIGTYGFFAALLGGGETVYFTNYTMPDSEWNTFYHYATAYSPQWHPIAADLSPLYAQLKATTKVPTTTVRTTKAPSIVRQTQTVPGRTMVKSKVPINTALTKKVQTIAHPAQLMVVPKTAVASKTIIVVPTKKVPISKVYKTKSQVGLTLTPTGRSTFAVSKTSVLITTVPTIKIPIIGKSTTIQPTARSRVIAVSKTVVVSKTTAAPKTMITSKTIVALKAMVAPKTTAAPKTIAATKTFVALKAIVAPKTTAAPKTIAATKSIVAPKTTAAPKTVAATKSIVAQK